MTSSTNATDLSGKVAVVTGAAAGLGRAEALGLARLGATVVVNDIAAALDASDVIDEIGRPAPKRSRSPATSANAPPPTNWSPAPTGSADWTSW